MAKFATFFHGILSGLEITCLQSFIDNGHDLTIFSYGDCGAPGHFNVADASTIVSEEDIFYYENGPGKGSISAFSNLFRYKLLSKAVDTWWIDTDVICLTPDWPEQHPIAAAWQSDKQINGAVLYCAHDIAAELSRRASAMGRNVEWGQAGPDLLTAYAEEKRLRGIILPTSAFYPVPYENWSMAFLANCLVETEIRCLPAYTLHLWNEMGRRCGFDKSILPDPDSFVGHLVHKHGTAKYFSKARPADRSSPSNVAFFSNEALLKRLAIDITAGMQRLESKIARGANEKSLSAWPLPIKISKWIGKDRPKGP